MSQFLSMIEIDDKIISTDILQNCFACDLKQCKGICCVEGNAGAPLEMEEVDLLEEEFEHFRPYMTEQGVEAIEKQGYMVIDEEGDYTTPLIDDAECAYSFEEDGITYCAIERAWREGKCSFPKPISCHLYPIRLAQFSNGTIGLNYHRWEICRSACTNGKKAGIPIYKALKEPLIRRFGKEFYDQLEEAARAINEKEAL